MGILSSDEQDLDHSLENNQFFHYIDNINYITIKESNGDEYKGERVEKQKHGRGILTYANHEKFKSYDGFWKNNQKHGQGTMYYKDGSTYIGKWKNDMRDGEGILYYSTGEKFCGQFKEDKKEGRGYYFSKNYNSIFHGYYKNDVKDGKGITYYKKINKISLELWRDGVIISCKFEKDKNNLITNSSFIKDESKLFSYMQKGDNKNKINSLNYKANIPNNFFDIMNLVIMTYTLLYDNGDINEWKENSIIKLFEKIGIEKNKYKDIILNHQINGTKFLKLGLSDLKEYKITDAKDVKIIMKANYFLRDFYYFYIKYFEYYLEYEKEEEIKLPKQISDSILNHSSSKNFMQKNNSSKKLSFNEEESNESLSKLNKISEEDLKENDSMEIISKKIERKRVKERRIGTTLEHEIFNSAKKNKILYQNKNINSTNILLPNKTKKKEIIENVGFTLTKMTITHLFIHSLFQNGFGFYIPFEEIEKEEEIEQDDICYQMFLGKWQGKKIILKCISIDRIKDIIQNDKRYSKLNIGNIMQNFIKEINICNNLRHPNVILFIGVSINKNDFYLILEHVENYTLYEILHKRKSFKKILKTPENETPKKTNTKEENSKKEENKINNEETKNSDDNIDISINYIDINDDTETETITPQKIKPYDKFHSLDEISQKKILFQIAFEICLGLRYIHSRNVIHCNLKTDYLFLDEEYHVKIGNFFYSKINNNIFDENKEEDYFMVNKSEWTPPEILGNGKFDESSDVYRLGLILYEIFTGEIPHKSAESNQIIGLNNIVSENDKKSRYLVNLIQKCVSEDPKNRPCLEDISNILYNNCKYYGKRDFNFEKFGNFILA